MTRKPINPITPDLLAEALQIDSVQIVDRDLIGSSSKRMERIDCILSSTHHVSRLFVKCSYVDGMIKELMLYDGLFQPFLTGIVDRIPRGVAYKTLNNGLHVLCTEYIEGYNPDFTDRIVVNRVFRQLGDWAARWNQAVKRHLQSHPSFQNNEFIEQLFQKEPLHLIFDEVIELSKGLQSVIEEIGGMRLVAFFDRLAKGLAEEIERHIFTLPLTFDPGDLSKYNTLIRQSDEAIFFLDFENANIRPMTQLVQSLGDNAQWGALPLGDLADYALNSYFKGWNQAAESPLSWDHFMIGYRASRVYYKCYKMKYLLYKIKDRIRLEEVMEWAKEGSQELLVTAEKAGYI